VIEVHDGIAPLAPEWDELADRAGAGPFGRPGWAAAWLRAFGPPGRVGVLALRGDGRLRAVLPLLRRGGVTAAPANGHTPRVELVAEDRAAAAELARAALALRQRRLTLAPVEAGAPTDVAVRAAAEAAGYRLQARTVLRSPYLPIPPGTAAAEDLLGRSMRKDLRRCRRRLDERGELSVQVERGAGDVAAVLAEAVAVEARQWKGRAGTAIASDPAVGAFYADVVDWAASRGLLHLAVLRLDGRAIAFEIDLLGGGALHSLKAGFDPAYGRFSPGHILALEAIDAALPRGVASYELLGDAEPYKLRWTSLCHEMVRLDASAPSAVGLADHLVVRHGHRAARAAVRYRYGLAAIDRARERVGARPRS
jgi:CelD/BcsL family acetyltransferase involved in cellulose biosynthesis